MAPLQVTLCNDSMILHKPSELQDKTNLRPLTWATLATWFTFPYLAPVAWHLILKSIECLKKIPSPTSLSRLFQTLIFFSIMSLATSTMTSKKHMYVICMHSASQTAQGLHILKYSGHHIRPVPAQTIISRNQLILKEVTEVLDPISCFASLGIVSWEEKFKISTLSTSEIKRKTQDEMRPDYIPKNIEAYSCIHGDTSPVARVSLARVQEREVL